MVDGPFGLLRKRFGRSIEFRVVNAARIVGDQLRTDIDARLDMMRAEAEADAAGRLIDQKLDSIALRLDELDRLRNDAADEADRRHRELHDRIAELQQQRRTMVTDDALERQELSTTLHALVADLGTSVGRISASITDSHRQQAAFLDRLTGRVEALETHAAVTPADTSDAT